MLCTPPFSEKKANVHNNYYIRKKKKKNQGSDIGEKWKTEKIVFGLMIVLF